jgi:hypothetical protein
MQIYEARSGETYVFQGPNSVTLGGEKGQPVELTVVGEMDLEAALAIANRDFARWDGQARVGNVPMNAVRRKQRTQSRSELKRA